MKFYIIILFLSVSLCIRLTSKQLFQLVAQKIHKNNNVLKTKQFRFIEKDQRFKVPEQKAKKQVARFSKSQNSDDSDGSIEQQEVHKGFLKISSPQFLNEAEFPNIKLESYEDQDQKYGVAGAFRINSDFENGGIPQKDDFWFYLVKDILFYTYRDDSTTVLGSLQISGIKSLKPACFRVYSQTNNEWDLCGADSNTEKEWKVALYSALDLEYVDTESDDSSDDENDISYHTKEVTQPIIMIPKPSRFCNDGWDYTQKGDDWECKCSETESLTQSPININEADAANFQCEFPVKFNFESISIDLLGLYFEGHQMIIKCNDSEEVCEKVIFSEFVDKTGILYESREIRFHTPAEHTINEQQAQMEVQLLFTAVTKGDLKRKAGLAFLIEEKAGRPNAFLDLIDPLSLPSELELYKPMRSLNTNVGIANLTLSDLFKQNIGQEYTGVFNYYNYQGSWTSPPCQEYVDWYIVKEPIFYRFSNINMITKVGDSYEKVDYTDADCNKQSKLITSMFGNSRNVQKCYGRQVSVFDMDMHPDKEWNRMYYQNETEFTDIGGHYEKLVTQGSQYLYVSGDEPSGIPGSVIVSKEEAIGNGKGIEQKAKLSQVIKGFINLGVLFAMCSQIYIFLHVHINQQITLQANEPQELKTEHSHKQNLNQIDSGFDGILESAPNPLDKRAQKNKLKQMTQQEFKASISDLNLSDEKVHEMWEQHQIQNSK